MSVADTLDARKKTHGDFTEHARVTQNLKAMAQNATGYGRLSSVQREAVEMILHKLGRILAGDPNHADHWHDIAGYASLAEARVQEIARTYGG